jgi:hypothetical protein
VKRKIPCFCDNTFTVEVPEEINLDLQSEYVEQILNGDFMAFTCSSCGKKHKPEFPIILTWPSRNKRFQVLPELERGEFYRKKRPVSKRPVSKSDKLEYLLGYPELVDRIMVLRDGLEPMAIEGLKYYLLLKAEEGFPSESSNPAGELSIWYHKQEGDTLEFHLYGLRKDEVAVTKVPRSLYEKTLGDYKKSPKSELFSSLCVHSYLSVQNLKEPVGSMSSKESK